MPDMPRRITIHRKDGRLQPNDGPRTALKPGQKAIFTLAAPATMLTITFVGESPFGKKQVPYGEELEVVVPFRNSGNVYRYECEEGTGGGEVEIIRN